MYVIGVDPGPLPGLLRLKLAPQTPGADDSPTLVLVDSQALQTTPGTLLTVLDALNSDEATVIALERYVVGPRAARSTTPTAGAVTRDMVGEVTAWATQRGLPLHTRSAGEVKPWATDVRLKAAGLLNMTAGMRHARDAARHALYCAVKDCGLPDPLSTRTVHWGYGSGGIGLAEHSGPRSRCPAPECRPGERT